MKVKKTICTTVVTLLMSCSQSMANFSGSDDFTAASLNLSKWAVPFGGDFSLTNLDGKLTFSTSDIYVQDSLDWILNVGSYTQNWAVTIDARINVAQHDFSMSEIYAGFSVLPIVDGFLEFSDYFDVALVKGQGFLGDDEPYYGVNSLGIIQEDYIANLFDTTQLLTNSPSISLRIAFNAQTKTLHSYYDFGEGYREVATMRVVDWGLCDHDGFTLSLFCGAEEIFVESGDATLDNFVATPSSDFPELPCLIGLPNFKGEDSFDDNVVDTNNWATYRMFGSFGEIDGQLVFTNSGSSYFPAMEWIANNGSYTQNWSATVNISKSIYGHGNGGGTGPILDAVQLLGLYCRPAKDPHLFSSIASPRWIEISPTYNAFVVFNEIEDISDPDLVVKGSNPYSETRLNINPDKLRISFDSTNKTLLAEAYDFFGWHELGSMDVVNWDMRQCDVFSLFLVGGIYDVEDQTYPQILAFDNFILESDVECTAGSSPDADVDGMLDAWEMQYFGSTSVSPTEHGDNDGLDNRSEYIAGTNPTNGTSVFNISEAGPSPSGFVLNWTSVPGRLYDVGWLETLTNTSRSLATDIPYPQSSYTDTLHAAEGRGFYELKVKLQN